MSQEADPAKYVEIHEDGNQRPKHAVEAFYAVQLVLLGNLFVFNLQRGVVENVVGLVAVKNFLRCSLPDVSEVCLHYFLIIY